MKISCFSILLLCSSCASNAQINFKRVSCMESMVSDNFFRVYNSPFVRYYFEPTKPPADIDGVDSTAYFSYLDLNLDSLGDIGYIPKVGYQTWKTGRNTIIEHKIFGFNEILDTMSFFRNGNDSFSIDSLIFKRLAGDEDGDKINKKIEGAWQEDSVTYLNMDWDIPNHKSSTVLNVSFEPIGSNDGKLSLYFSNESAIDTFETKYKLVNFKSLIMLHTASSDFQFCRMFQPSDNTIILTQRITYPPDNVIRKVVLKRMAKP